MIEEKKNKPKPKPGAVEMTTDEWPLRLGLFTTSKKLGKTPRIKTPIWQHRSAAALHGWEQHKHDTQEPMKITEEDYQAALKAIEGQPPLEPHKGALSKHCKHAFKG